MKTKTPKAKPLPISNTGLGRTRGGVAMAHSPAPSNLNGELLRELQRLQPSLSGAQQGGQSVERDRSANDAAAAAIKSSIGNDK